MAICRRNLCFFPSQRPAFLGGHSRAGIGAGGNAGLSGCKDIGAEARIKWAVLNVLPWQGIVRHSNVEVGIEFGRYFPGKELAHGLACNTPKHLTEQKALSYRMIGDRCLAPTKGSEPLTR